jgi:hypothetical protein
LSDRLDSLSARVRSGQLAKSLVDFRQTCNKSPGLPGSLSSQVLTNLEVSNMPGCGGCHGPCGSGEHLGSRKGYAACTLVHYSGCPGSVDPVAGKVRPCPDGYVLGVTLPAAVPAEAISDSEYVSEQRLSTLEDETEEDNSESEKKVKSLDKKEESQHSSRLVTSTTGSVTTASTKTFLTRIETPSVFTAASGTGSLPFPTPPANTPLLSIGTNPVGIQNLLAPGLLTPLSHAQPGTDPTLVLQQQLAALMSQQLQMANAQAKEQQQQALVRQQEREQLAEVQKQHVCNKISQISRLLIY